MEQRALVTGGSGFLGGFVVRELLAEGFDLVYVLMRGGEPGECAQRLRSLWWERSELAGEVGARVRVVCGDVRAERLGMSSELYTALAHEVTHVVHAAAEIGVNETARQFSDVNVEGTLNVLLFADECAAHSGF